MLLLNKNTQMLPAIGQFLAPTSLNAWNLVLPSILPVIYQSSLVLLLWRRFCLPYEHLYPTWQEERWVCLKMKCEFKHFSKLNYPLILNEKREHMRGSPLFLLVKRNNFISSLVFTKQLVNQKQETGVSNLNIY